VVASAERPRGDVVVRVRLPLFQVDVQVLPLRVEVRVSTVQPSGWLTGRGAVNVLVVVTVRGPPGRPGIVNELDETNGAAAPQRGSAVVSVEVWVPSGAVLVVSPVEAMLRRTRVTVERGDLHKRRSVAPRTELNAPHAKFGSPTPLMQHPGETNARGGDAAEALSQARRIEGEAKAAASAGARRRGGVGERCVFELKVQISRDPNFAFAPPAGCRELEWPCSATPQERGIHGVAARK
jgi:hypothetical protein